MYHTFKFTLASLLALTVTACANGENPTTPPSPTASPTASASPSTGTPSTGTDGNGLFANALSRRSLDTEAFAGNSENSPQGQESADAAVGAPGAAPAIAPVAPPGVPMGAPAADVAEGGARLGIPYFGGGPFQQYQLEFVEELTFAAPTGNSLLSYHQQDVKPLVQEWANDARLVLSSASEGAPGETYYLPNAAGEPEKADTRSVFQWVSSEKKETLMVYVLSNAVRVHRMVWGEQDLDLSRVSIDSAQAQKIARDAFGNRNDEPGYPVFPMQRNVRNGLNILYAVPADARWSFSLSQQQQSLTYFVSVNFQHQANGREHYVSGYAEINAVTGEIQQLNRPSWYDRSRDVDMPTTVDAGPPEVLR